VLGLHLHQATCIILPLPWYEILTGAEKRLKFAVAKYFAIIEQITIHSTDTRLLQDFYVYTFAKNVLLNYLQFKFIYNFLRIFAIT
jgi:hypothetical protein